MRKKEYEFLKGTKTEFAIALFFIIVFNLGTIVPAYLMQWIVDAGTERNWDKIYRIITLACIYCAIYLILGSIRNATLKKYMKHAVYNYKSNYIQRIMSMPYRDYIKHDSARYISNLTNNAKTIEDGYILGRLYLIRSSLRVIVVIVLLLLLNWKLFLITIVSFAIPLAGSAFVNKRIVKLTSEKSTRSSNFLNSLTDLLGGFSIIKSFNAEKEVRRSVEKTINDLEDTSSKLRFFDGTAAVFSDFSTLLVEIVIFFVGIVFVMHGQMTIGSILAYSQLLIDLQVPLELLPGIYANYNAGKKLIKEDYIEITEDKGDKTNVDSITDGIDIQDLVFGYTENEKVLKGIDMHISNNELYAIVGGSGCGKTTFSNILRGNYDNYEGKITISNTDLKKIGNIYDLISVIDQNTFVFNDSIYNNISMYKDFDEESVRKAIELSGLSELVRDKGIDYNCGENGNNLSGGEKQRISIARALLTNKEFIIMDESTASLDVVTANSIENNIINLDQTTRLVITHKLNDTFLKKCDRIFVMKNGRIVENGTFDDLLENKGAFYSMYELWT